MEKLFIYNTLSRKKEVFKPQKKSLVTLYTCGPTVYNFAHLGNMRTFVFDDILERSLGFLGYKVKRIMNITDVGHLTGDSDAGEDKMEKEAKTPAEVSKIANFYIKAFVGDAKKLNIRIPKKLVRATKCVPEQIKMVSLLLKKGYAYETSSAVYFDVAKFKKYGALAQQSLKDKLVAARDEVVLDEAKKNSADFALWFKLVGKFENHIQRWNSPWGKGFPGWHIECSAIASNYLGKTIDIHTGGVDHIGTHHTNEIAQSEAANQQIFARYWMHGEFLLIDNSRMGKSMGNFFTVSTLKEKHINPLAYRYLLLTAHYRSQLNFTWESLESASRGLENLYASYAKIFEISKKEGVAGVSKKEKVLWNSFLSAIANDLDTPKALAVAYEVISSKEITARTKIKLLDRFDEVLGLDLKKNKKAKEMKQEDVPFEIKELARRREELRLSRQFKEADSLRDEIYRLGYRIDDTPDGPKLVKAS